MANKKNKKNGDEKERVRSRAFCFTINNYTKEEEFLLLFLTKPMTYISWGYEVGDSGTKHIQGYLELARIMDRDQVSSFPEFRRAHLELRRGSQASAIKYTQKDGNFFTLGEPYKTQQGLRRDLDSIRLMALEHGMKEITSVCSYQQIKVAEKYLEYNEPARNWKPTIMWFHGKTGTGKTRVAHELSKNPYIKSEGSKWWNGYDRHEDVIIDDFRDGHMTFNELLTLLDRYERRIETKGGMRQFVPKQIIITCNKHPNELYSKINNERKDQLLRRIDIIQEFGNEVAGVIVDPATNAISNDEI